MAGPLAGGGQPSAHSGHRRPSTVGVNAGDLPSPAPRREPVTRPGRMSCPHAPRPQLMPLQLYNRGGMFAGMRFDVLAEPARRRILDLLLERPRPVAELTAELGLSQPGTSKHLKVLREAGLVTVRADVQRRWYELRPQPLAEIDAWLAPYRALWSGSLDRLERHLDTMGRRRTALGDPPRRRRQPAHPHPRLRRPVRRGQLRLRLAHLRRRPHRPARRTAAARTRRHGPPAREVRDRPRPDLRRTHRRRRPAGTPAHPARRPDLAGTRRPPRAHRRAAAQ